MTFCFQRAVAATVFQLSSQNQDHQFFKSKKVECCFWHFPKFSLLRGVIWRPREKHFGRTPCIYNKHCWLEQVSNCQQSWPDKNYMFFIPITITEIAASNFFPVTVWTPGGAAIIFTQSWNFKLKFFLGIPFMKKIGSRGGWVHSLPKN